MKERFLHIAVWAALALLGGAAGARAQAVLEGASGMWASADYAQARLVAGAGSDDAREAGLEVRLAPGWHSYWRMPGDAGLAPQMDWGGSENVRDVAVSYPVPRRFIDLDMHSFGYEGQYMMPLAVTVADAGRDARLVLDLNMMVCEKICVPQRLKAALDLPAQARVAPQAAVLAAVRVPREGDMPDLKVENMVIGPDALVARVYAARGFSRFDMFVESGDVYVTAKPEVTVDEKDPLYAQVKIAAPPGVANLYDAITGRTVTLTVTDGTNAIERNYDF